MKYIIFLVLAIICSGLSTCKKEPPVEVPLPPPTSSSALELVWQVSSPYYSAPPLLNSNGDVLMSATFSNQAKGEVFKLMDSRTGELRWEWSDYFKPAKGFSKRLSKQRNDILVLSDRNYNYGVNMLTGQTIWRNIIDSIGAEPQIYEDADGYIYKGFRSLTQQSMVYIMRAMYNTGNWELVCTYQDPNPIPGRFEVASIGVTQNTKGEKVAVFTIYTYPQNRADSTKALIIGYNTITKNFDWVRNYSDFLMEFSVSMYSRNEGLVYAFANYGTTYYVIAFNADNGDIVWKRQLPNYGVGFYDYNENLIITTRADNPVISLNAKTGNLIWQQTFSILSQDQRTFFGYDYDDSQVYKNYLLTPICKHFLALNLDNGSIAYFEKAALPEGCLQSGIVVDEQKKVFYTEDRLRLLCYKLPEVLK